MSVSPPLEAVGVVVVFEFNRHHLPLLCACVCEHVRVYMRACVRGMRVGVTSNLGIRVQSFV